MQRRRRKPKCLFIRLTGQTLWPNRSLKMRRWSESTSLDSSGIGWRGAAVAPGTAVDELCFLRNARPNARSKHDAAREDVTAQEEKEAVAADFRRDQERTRVAQCLRSAMGRPGCR